MGDGSGFRRWLTIGRLATVAGALSVAVTTTLAGSTAVNLSDTRTDLTPEDRARVRAVTRPTTDFSGPERFEAMAGGAAISTKLVNRDAFSHSSANLTLAEEERFKLGNALFRKLWVSSPSSTQASDGLGPLFNARACQSCHLKDGRGHPPEGSADATSMSLRLARAPANDEERQALADHFQPKLPDPVYCGQLQDQAVPGMKAEGRMVVGCGLAYAGGRLFASSGEGAFGGIDGPAVTNLFFDNHLLAVR